MADKKKPIAFIRFRDYLLYLAAWSIAGALLFVTDLQLAHLTGWVLITLLPSMFFLVIVPHELGHFVFGSLAGFRPVALVLGSVWFRFVGPKPKIGLSKAFMNGGYVVVKPKAGLKGNAIVPLMLGGFMTNFLIAAALAPLWIKSLVDLQPGMGPFHPTLILTAICINGVSLSLVVAFKNARAISTFGFQTDGFRVRQHFRDRASTEVLFKQMEFAEQAFAGNRPRDWDWQLAEWLLEHISNPVDRTYHLLGLYEMHLDADNVDRAEEYLNAALEEAEKQHSMAAEVAYVDAAFFYAYYRGDLERSEAMARKSQLMDIEPSARQAYKAAAAFAKGEFGQARLFAEDYLSSLGAPFSPGTRIPMTETMRELIARCGKEATANRSTL